MKAALTFGGWLKRQRGGLGLTQKELAQKVGYAEVTLRKVEADELRPSRQMAEKLAEALKIAAEKQAQFVSFARDEAGWDEVAFHAQEAQVVLPAIATKVPHSRPVRLVGMGGHQSETPELPPPPEPERPPHIGKFIGRKATLRVPARLARIYTLDLLPEKNNLAHHLTKETNNSFV